MLEINLAKTELAQKEKLVNTTAKEIKVASSAVTDADNAHKSAIEAQKKEEEARRARVLLL